MKWKIGSQGSFSFEELKKTVAVSPFPLEMEKNGKTYRGGFSQGTASGGFTGFLSDPQGPFLSCEVVFQKRTYAGQDVLEERRSYRALRDIPRALLTVRYFMEPVQKPEDGFLVIPALWYGDNEAWHNRVVYPKGIGKDWSFKADGSSCPAVVWTSYSWSYAVASDASVSFSVRHKGLDDVLGIGFAGMKRDPQAVFTFPAQQVPKSYPRARKLSVPQKPRLNWKKGQSLELTLYHSVSKPDRGFHNRVWRSHYQRASAPFRYTWTGKDLKKTAGLFTHCLKRSHFLEGKGFSHRHDIPEIFTGWCGGFAAAYAALRWADATEDPELRRMGETMCDYICREGISDSGIFYSENANDVWLDKVFWGQA